MNLLKDDVIVSKITIALFLQKGGGTPIHNNRPTHGLAFNIDCESTYTFDTGEVLTCHSGEVIFLPKGSNYIAEGSSQDTQNPKEAGVYAINFLTTDAEEAPSKPFVIKARGIERITSLFSKASQAWYKKETGYKEECFSDLYQIIRLLKKEQGEYSQTQKSLAVLEPALEYINANYTKENIRIDFLAGLCKISEPYLRKLFMRTFSIPPATYIRNLRIRYAKELILTGDYTMTDVAFLSGFNDSAYFSREFKKATGVSPREYK